MSQIVRLMNRLLPSVRDVRRDVVVERKKTNDSPALRRVYDDSGRYWRRGPESQGTAKNETHVPHGAALPVGALQNHITAPPSRCPIELAPDNNRHRGPEIIPGLRCFQGGEPPRGQSPSTADITPGGGGGCRGL